MRLDHYLVSSKAFKTRNQAQTEIKHGRITVNGDIVQKPSFQVTDADRIECMRPFNPYLSKGGLKLAHALDCFKIDVKAKRALDIGASTGGFTDCLLKHGASHVTALDVGTDQLDDTLRNLDTVHVIENMHFLDFSTEALFDIAVMDVSFISSVSLIEHAFTFLRGPLILCLKPQFESRETPKNGVVKKAVHHYKVFKAFQENINRLGYYIQQATPSPIKGGSGNIEFMCLIDTKPHHIDIKSIVDSAHQQLN